MSSPRATRALAVVALAAAGALAACKSPSAPLPTVEQPLATLAVDTLAGDKFDPATLDGKVVLVNFWNPG